MAANVALPTAYIRLYRGATTTGSALTQFTAANYTVVSDVRDVSGPNQTKDFIDVSHFESPSYIREYIPAMGDAGEVTFEINFNPNNTNQDFLYKTDFSETGNRNWAIRLNPGQGASTTLTTAAVISFVGNVSEVNIDNALNSASRATMSIRVSGAIAFTQGGA